MVSVAFCSSVNKLEFTEFPAQTPQVPVPLPLPLSPPEVEEGDGAAREEGLPVPLPEPVSGSVPLGVTPPRTPPSVSAPGSPGDAEAEAVPRKLLPSPKIPVVVVNRSGTWPPPQQPQPPPPPPQVPFTGTYPVIPPEDGSLASLMERVARESAVPAERGMVDLGGGSGVEYPFSPTQPGSLTPSPLLPRSGAADANADAAAAPQTPAPPVEDVTNPWAWLALLGSGIFAFSALMDLASWHSQSALVWVPVLLSLLVIAVVAWGWGKRHGDSGQVMTIFGVVLGGIGALCYLASSMDDSGRPARPQSELAKSDFAKVQASGDVEAMKELARDGDAEAQMELWRLIENGRVKPAHDAERIEWMRDAAEQGHAGAQCALAEAYERGDSALIPKDEVTAATWFQAAANRGSPRAQGKLGGYYALGRGGLTQSGNLALRYWRQGAEKDDPLALYELGHAYETGYVAPVAMAEAVRFYQKAAERGQAEAMVRLAICYSEGKGVEKDERAFRRWINEAIDRGSREAMYQKGWAHEYGEGFPPE